MKLVRAPMSVRHAVLTLVATLLLGGCLLLLAWQSDIKDQQRRTAPPCAPSQVFTQAKCRAELDGTVTSITRDRVEVDVDGHALGMDITISQQVPAVTGHPVRVTLYRGAPVRVVGDHLNVGPQDTPANNRNIFGFLGLLFPAGGVVALLVALSARRHPG
ncbi:hypothetical protein AB0J72_57070 [Dactylosporangium sp. NPDC049742]|uniref:hypothetical protein n=1 Tax=Dactylosporangium sp. NPDC049742 TaxID=3154737 RepID=UPI00341FC4C4